MMAKKQVKKQSNSVIISYSELFIGVVGWIVIGAFLGALAFANSERCGCSGVGGFVYEEIAWADQTYNVMDANCRGEDGELSALYYNDYGQFYCIVSVNEEGVRIPTYTTYIVPVTNIGVD